MGDTKITLEAARVNAGLTQEQAARIINVSTRTYLEKEKEPATLSVGQFRVLCEAFKMPEHAIFIP